MASKVATQVVSYCEPDCWWGIWWSFHAFSGIPFSCQRPFNGANSFL